MGDRNHELLDGIMNANVADSADKLDDFLIRTDKSKEETVTFYDKWASTYDKDVNKAAEGYNNPDQIASAMAEVLGQNKDVRILDLGAGTGLAGLSMKKHGFHNIDGLDGSQGMLDKAKSRGIYKHYFCEIVTEEKLNSVQDNEYDALLTTGCFVPGHIDAKCLRTLGRPVKPGGYVGICMRVSFLEHPSLIDTEPTLLRLCEEGFWRLVKREQVPNFYSYHDGIVFVLQRL